MEDEISRLEGEFEKSLEALRAQMEILEREIAEIAQKLEQANERLNNVRIEQ